MAGNICFHASMILTVEKQTHPNSSQFFCTIIEAHAVIISSNPYKVMSLAAAIKSALASRCRHGDAVKACILRPHIRREPVSHGLLRSISSKVINHKPTSTLFPFKEACYSHLDPVPSVVLAMAAAVSGGDGELLLTCPASNPAYYCLQAASEASQ